jgi:hypothetical protein
MAAGTSLLLKGGAWEALWQPAPAGCKVMAREKHTGADLYIVLANTLQPASAGCRVLVLGMIAGPGLDDRYNQRATTRLPTAACCGVSGVSALVSTVAALRVCLPAASVCRLQGVGALEARWCERPLHCAGAPAASSGRLLGDGMWEARR